MTENRKTVWYFGLEPVKARYTRQLSQEWIPNAFAEHPEVDFQPVDGATEVDDDIKVGAVLDASNRGVYAMQQSSNFLQKIANGDVKAGDALYVQDFWHPGLEAIYYALELNGINIDIFAMLHAQSVDEYDFTHSMRDWMRPIEIGYANKMKAIFVGSTIHKKQLRAAGIETPIHVVSLPYGKKETEALVPNKDSIEKQDQIMFCSRLDKEKNPYFLARIVEWVCDYTDWKFIITTSGKEFRSNLLGVVEMFQELEERYVNFEMLSDLSKTEYYTKMAESKIVLNTSLQDYVSWTSIEAHTFGCNFLAPNFRSFGDFCDQNKTYFPFDFESAISKLSIMTTSNESTIIRNLSGISDLGRRLVARIICNPINYEVNIWHEFELCKNLVK